MHLTISTLGAFKTAQLFHPLAIAVSNRGECAMYEDMINIVFKMLLGEYSTVKINFTMSNNADAIAHAFRKLFLQRLVLKFLFLFYQKYEKN